MSSRHDSGGCSFRTVKKLSLHLSYIETRATVVQNLAATERCLENCNVSQEKEYDKIRHCVVGIKYLPESPGCVPTVWPSTLAFFVLPQIRTYGATFNTLYNECHLAFADDHQQPNPTIGTISSKAEKPSDVYTGVYNKTYSIRGMHTENPELA